VQPGTASIISGVKQFSSTPVFSNGITVSSGSISLPNQSVASSCIVNSDFVSLGTAQTISSVKTHSATPIFQAGLNVSGGSVTLPNASVSSGSINNTHFFDLTTAGQVVSAAKTFSGATRVNQIQESIVNLGAVSSNSLAVNYASGSTFYASPANATNNAVAFTNVPTSSTYSCYTITVIFDAATYKTYCNSATVNGTATTILYIGGSAAISVASASVIVQTFFLLYTSSASTPWRLLSTVAGCSS
jgi:hypothetical protein